MFNKLAAGVKRDLAEAHGKLMRKWVGPMCINVNLTVFGDSSIYHSSLQSSDKKWTDSQCVEFECIDRIDRIVYFRHYRPIKNHTFGHRGVKIIIKKYIIVSRCIGPIGPPLPMLHSYHFISQMLVPSRNY